MNAEAEMAGADGLGTELTPPEGCTGAVMYDREGRPSIQHDAATCPVHEDAEPLEQLRHECGYSPDGEDEGVDALIDYKDALEGIVGRMEADLERTEAALTQIQHVTHDGLVKVEEGTTWYVRYHFATEIIQKAQSIAEGQQADPEFVAMLAAANREDQA